MRITQRKAGMFVALLCLLLSVLATSVFDAPPAFAGSGPNPTPTPSPQPSVVPGPGSLTTITITPGVAGAEFEFTPYQLSIALNVKGIRIKNMTNQEQV